MGKVAATVPTRVMLKMLPPSVGDAMGWAIRERLPNRISAEGLEQAIAKLAEQPFDGVVTAVLTEQLKLVAENLRAQDAARAIARTALEAPRDGEALTDVAGTRAPAAPPSEPDVVEWKPSGGVSRERKLELFEKQGFVGPLAPRALALGVSLKVAGMLARAEIDRAAALDALEHGATAEDLLAWHPTGVPVADIAKLISAGMTLETWKEQRSRGPVNAAGVSGLIDEGIVPADWPSAQRLMNAGLSLSEVKQFLALDLPAMPRLKEMASRSADTQATLRAKCFGNVALALEQAPLTVPEVLRWAAAGTFDTILNDQLLGLAYAKMGLSFEQARAAAGFSIGSNDFRVAKEAGYSVDELLAFHAAGFGKPFSNTRFYLTQLGTFARAGFTAAQVVEAYPLALEVDDVRALSKAGCTAGEILDLAHAGRADAQSFEDDYLSLGLTPSEAVAEILAESF